MGKMDPYQPRAGELVVTRNWGPALVCQVLDQTYMLLVADADTGECSFVIAVQSMALAPLPTHIPPRLLEAREALFGTHKKG